MVRLMPLSYSAYRGGRLRKSALAEGEGFEPPKACTLVVFKTGVASFISVRRRSPSFAQYT